MYHADQLDVGMRDIMWSLGGLLEIHLSEAGMHLFGWLPPWNDGRCATELAAGTGIDVTAVSR
ncbi:MAG: hypothetical protein PVSMB4_03990 [Ktedonobacterales bacterium]